MSYLFKSKHVAILISALAPAVFFRVIATVFLVENLHIDPIIVGIYSVSDTIVGIVMTHLLGKHVLVGRDPAKMVAFAIVMTIAGMGLLLPVSGSLFWLIPATLCSAASGILIPSLFAYSENHYALRESEHLYQTRMLISLVWIIAPAAAFLLYWAGGIHLVLTAATSLAGFALLMVWFSSRQRGHDHAMLPTEISTIASEPVDDPWDLFAIAAIMILITGANVVHAITMPLYLLSTLQAPAYLPGWSMTVAATAETVIIACLPFMVRQHGETKVLVVAVIIGLGYFLSISHVTNIGILVALQVAYGIHFALSTTVCLGILRKVSYRHVGTLTAQFVNSEKIGSLLGSAIFGLFATAIGYHDLLTVAPLILLVLASPLTLYVGTRVIPRATARIAPSQ